MAGRRTNLALAGIVLLALGTGLASYALGTSSGRAVVIAHGIAGLSLLVLAPWKSVIAARGLGRMRPGRLLSILLAVAAVLTVATGVLFSTGLVLRYGSLTAIQLHVGAGVATTLLVLLHMRKRPVRPRLTDLSRRNLLRTGSLAAVAGVVWLGIEGTARAAGWRGSDRRFTGSHETGSFDPPRMPVTQWFNDSVPRIDTSAWQLSIRAGEPRSLNYAQLTEYNDQVEATIDCTGGWYATQEWTGVRLDQLLGPLKGGSLRVVSFTGYERRIPTEHARQVWLAHSVGGRPLSVGHGAPARLVVPNRRGFWWVKWVTEITHDTRPAWWQLPFPAS
ncbi:MAG: molybdopterin-dependent oxidoreductase [Acidimicrobiia bacterium]